MDLKVDFSRLRTSWTKYDIVRVMEVIYNIQTIEKFKKKEAIIDEPILRSFLGINSLNDPLPYYWTEIQKYPKEKNLFALLSVLFTHGGVVNDFAYNYATGNMKGLFKIAEGKQYTNIRSALIESGAASPIYRRREEVPYELTPLFQNVDVGKLFKQVLIERLSRLADIDFIAANFYEVCYSNNFHKALSLTENQFRNWLEGGKNVEGSYVEKVQILNFFSVSEANLDFDSAKEMYFLGENGDGKSLILLGTYLAFNGNFIIEATDQEQTGKATDIIRNNKEIILQGIDNEKNIYSPKINRHLKNFFAYGTHRGRTSTDNPEQYGFMSLFDSEQTLTNPVSWLKDQYLLNLEKELDKFNMFGEIKNLPESLSNKLLEQMFFNLLEKNVEVKIEANGIFFIEKGNTVTFDQLSEGYKSILIFVSDLLYRLSLSRQEGISITDTKAVVIVDEIDLHLHPKWQRIIISRLRILFPNIQFIFTTHSPTIIQGASEDAIIYRVYRNKEDGKTKVTEPYFRKDLDHLMINSLLTSPLFGLQDSRMNPNDEVSDTSDSYLLYRINRKLEQELEKQKSSGKEFISDKSIDDLIQNIINEESNRK